jgi:hypothetical protein
MFPFGDRRFRSVGLEKFNGIGIVNLREFLELAATI